MVPMLLRAVFFCVYSPWPGIWFLSLYAYTYLYIHYYMYCICCCSFWKLSKSDNASSFFMSNDATERKREKESNNKKYSVRRRICFHRWMDVYAFGDAAAATAIEKDSTLRFLLVIASSHHRLVHIVIYYICVCFFFVSIVTTSIHALCQRYKR